MMKEKLVPIYHLIFTCDCSNYLNSNSCNCLISILRATWWAFLLYHILCQMYLVYHRESVLCCQQLLSYDCWTHSTLLCSVSAAVSYCVVANFHPPSSVYYTPHTTLHTTIIILLSGFVYVDKTKNYYYITVMFLFLCILQHAC